MPSLRQRWSHHRNSLIQHSSRVLANGGNVFLRKPIRVRVFASTPGSPRGSRRRRMGNDDSVQIAAMSSRRRRAFARMWRGERASGREMVGGIVVAVGAAPIARNRNRRGERMGNFPPCKALKTHKMRKESRFCASPFRRPESLRRRGRRDARWARSRSQRCRPDDKTGVARKW